MRNLSAGGRLDVELASTAKVSSAGSAFSTAANNFHESRYTPWLPIAQHGVEDDQQLARHRDDRNKWRLKHRAVADSLEDAGDRLFTFTRLPLSQWRSARTTNAIERLHEEFKRRIKTQTVLPSADTVAMLFWALLASSQINRRKVDGWQTLATKPIDQPIDLAA